MNGFGVLEHTVKPQKHTPPRVRARRYYCDAPMSDLRWFHTGASAGMGSRVLEQLSMRLRIGPALVCAAKSSLIQGQPVFIGTAQYEITRKVYLWDGF